MIITVSGYDVYLDGECITHNARTRDDAYRSAITMQETLRVSGVQSTIVFA